MSDGLKKYSIDCVHFDCPKFKECNADIVCPQSWLCDDVINSIHRLKKDTKKVADWVIIDILEKRLVGDETKEGGGKK